MSIRTILGRVMARLRMAKVKQVDRSWPPHIRPLTDPEASRMFLEDFWSPELEKALDECDRFSAESIANAHKIVFVS